MACWTDQLIDEWRDQRVLLSIPFSLGLVFLSHAVLAVPGDGGITLVVLPSLLLCPYLP